MTPRLNKTLNINEMEKILNTSKTILPKYKPSSLTKS